MSSTAAGTAMSDGGGIKEFMRKRGTPWTEEEHRLFLLGLQKLGKGDWRGISRNFVITRTPTQVASHAQKYFLRRSSANCRRRRYSLFNSLFSMNNGNDSNDVDEGDNNGGGGDKNKKGGGDKKKKKGGGSGDGGGSGGGNGDGGGSGGGNGDGGGSGDGEGNGDGGDKAEGGDGKEKGMNMDCTGQPGFGYRCTYHAGFENEYPVEQLTGLKSIRFKPI